MSGMATINPSDDDNCAENNLANLYVTASELVYPKSWPPSVFTVQNKPGVTVLDVSSAMILLCH